MSNHRPVDPFCPGWRFGALLCAGLLVSEARPAQAFPLAPPQVEARQGVWLLQVPGASLEAEVRMPFEELNAALAAARAKLEDLTGAAEIAAIATGLREELDELKQENRRLAVELDEARGALDATAAALAEAEAEVAARDEALAQRAAKEATLVQAAQHAAAQVARLHDELKISQEQLAAADAARDGAEARRLETAAALELSEGLAAKLRVERDDARQQLAKALHEQQEARASAEAFQAKAKELQQDLIAAHGEIERLDAENASRYEEVAQFRAAADAAADAARNNLIAVEDKIRMLNDALAGVTPAGESRPERAPSTSATEGDGMSDKRPSVLSAGVTRAAAAAETNVGIPLPPALPAQLIRQQLAAPAPAADARTPRAAGSGGTQPGPSGSPMGFAARTMELPLEQRVQVENLLADVKGRPRADGLLLTVPGGDLFGIESEEIGAGAHEMLARVAELINIYGDRQVLIMGHTDAIGEASYNKALSERRADLVKRFFVEHFAIDAARLSTTGLGEEHPIASNSTRAGREANRRIEVLVMN